MGNSTFALITHRHFFASFFQPAVEPGTQLTPKLANRFAFKTFTKPKGTRYLQIIELFKTHNNLSKADMADLLDLPDLNRPGWYSSTFKSFTQWGILKYDRKNKWQAGPRFNEFIEFANN